MLYIEQTSTLYTVEISTLYTNETAALYAVETPTKYCCGRLSLMSSFNPCPVWVSVGTARGGVGVFGTPAISESTYWEDFDTSKLV